MKAWAAAQIYFLIVPTSLHHEIHAIADKHKHAKDFLSQRSFLKSLMSCTSCSAAMTLTACSASKSPDLLIWRCSSCKKYKNIRTDSTFSGQKLSLQTFLMLTFYLSIKSLTSIAVAQLTDLSDNIVSEWKILLHVRVEMNIIDENHFNHFQETKGNKDATELLKGCKKTLTEELLSLGLPLYTRYPMVVRAWPSDCI